MVFKDVDTMREAEPAAVQATELLHFKIHSPRSPYGVPRWIGNLLAVIGSRQSEEVNFNYFENKSVPPLVILVSGGRMTKDSVTRVTEYVETYIKGKRNFHRILVLEADAGDGKASETNTSKMKIDIKPLTSAQQQDALFQNYDERNIDKVGQSFRLPRMLRGDIRDFNRATSDAALVFAEVQVFEPERQEFDFVLNRKILSAMGIRFWKLVSMAPVIRDPVSMSEIIKNLSNANVLTPEESRELAGDVFNKTFTKLNAAWTKQPGALTIAGIPVEGAPNAEQPGDPNFSTGGEVAPEKPTPLGVESSAKQKITKSLAREAGRLIKLKQIFETMEEDAWQSYLQEHARSIEG
jgi:capsid portal protein